jgi:hypothetical protein
VLLGKIETYRISQQRIERKPKFSAPSMNPQRLPGHAGHPLPADALLFKNSDFWEEKGNSLKRFHRGGFRIALRRLFW